MDAEPETIAKVHCAKCGGERNCAIRGSFEKKNADPNGYYFWQTDWRILQCCGCDYVFVQTVSIHSEDYDFVNSADPELDGTVEYNESKNYWPSISTRAKPDWFDALSAINLTDLDRLIDSLNELYGALNAGVFTLSSIGIRTSFDIAAELLEVEESLPFKGKLKALVDLGHIGALDLDRIDTLVEAGSASAHRGWRPNSNDLSVMMDVLEHFLHEAFVAPENRRLLDEKARKVKSNVPLRKQRKPHQNPKR